MTVGLAAEHKIQGEGLDLGPVGGITCSGAGSRSSGQRYVLRAALRDPQSFVLFDGGTAVRAAITNVNLNILKRDFSSVRQVCHI